MPTTIEPATFPHFLAALVALKTRGVDRAVAVIWWRSRDDIHEAMTPAQVAAVLEGNGLGKQNITRLRSALRGDRRTVTAPGGAFRIRLDARPKLDEQLVPLLGTRPVVPSSSVLPMDLVHKTRGYIEKVALQLNASYDYGLFDCCAVMCRRLVETLIIELYEADKRQATIKGTDGTYLMLAGLVGTLTTDQNYTLSRNALKGLGDLKRLGDHSAHSRMFIARRSDIDRVRDGLRVAVEELVTLARLQT